MPIKKSALKRMRADKKIHQRNLRLTNDIKTRVKNFRLLLADKKKDDALAAFKDLSSRIDKAAKKKLIHKNKASRTISRLKKALLSAA